MAALPWLTYSEKLVGKNHPSLADTTNRALRALLSQSGYDPDASPFPGLMGPVYNVKAAGGAAGDDSSNDTSAIQSVMVAGRHVVIPAGTYKVSTAIAVPENTVVQFLPGATIKQYTETEPAIEFAGSGSTLIEPSVMHATTSTRRTNGLIEVVAVDNWKIFGGNIGNAAGLGLYVGRSVNGRVFGTRKTGVGLSDGFHVTNGGGSGHVSKDIKFFGCHAEDTDDDTFAVISYTGASQAIVEDVEFHGCHSLRSGARGFTLTGKNIKVYGGSVRDCDGSAGLNIILDETAVTFNPEDIEVYGLYIGAATGSTGATRHGIAVYRARRVKLFGVIGDSWAGGGEDCKVYGSAGDYSEDVELASCYINGSQSGGRHLLMGDRVRRLRVHDCRLVQGYKSAWSISNYEDVRIEDNEVDEINYENSGAANVGTLATGSVFTSVRRNVIKHGSRNITHGVAFSTITGPVRSQDNDYTQLTATYSGQLESIVSTTAMIHGMSSDRGDADVTLTVGADCETQRFETALTTNRTVTLATAGAVHGSRFRICRFAGASGASTLTVAGKALAVSQWALVEYNGRVGNWRLVEFGAL